MTRLLEELSLNALPALQTLVYDGWVLRLSEGYTRRANSITPLYPCSDPLAAVRHCEQIYKNHGLPAIFKMTPFNQPPELESVLDKLGYRYDPPVVEMQTASLAEQTWSIDPTAALVESLQPDWLDTFCRMRAMPEPDRSVLARMLPNITPATCYAVLEQAGQPAAVGLAVLEGEWLGLFDITTDPDLRRRGLGRRLVESLLGWGQQRGARYSYLQVVDSNTPALNLYTGMGFRKSYAYYYRAGPSA